MGKHGPVKPSFLWRFLIVSTIRLQQIWQYRGNKKRGGKGEPCFLQPDLPAVIKQRLREKLCALQLFRLRLKDVFQFFPSFSGCFSVSFSSKQRDQENKISWVPCFSDAWRGMRGVTERAAQLYENSESKSETRGGEDDCEMEDSQCFSFKISNYVSFHCH